MPLYEFFLFHFYVVFHGKNKICLNCKINLFIHLSVEGQRCFPFSAIMNKAALNTGTGVCVYMSLHFS